MGSGIAQVIAEAGYPVIVVEVNEEKLKKTLDIISNNLDLKVKKGKCTLEHVQKTLSLINGQTEIETVMNSDLIIEAIPEELGAKQSLFKHLDELVQPNCILASNTSGLSIAALGSVTKRPEKVIGFHFFYPATVMKLVEVIPSIVTSKQTYDQMVNFSKDIGKNPVRCPDYPGFLVNRILIPMVNEAINCVMEGARPSDVDEAMELGANHRMGPIKLADFVGLDVLLATMKGLYEGFSDSKYRPSPLLKKMVESGNLGRKTGRGFYLYDEKGNIIGTSI
jgi:3-hydroxybutyryl-CoA dehydrogenase